MDRVTSVVKVKRENGRVHNFEFDMVCMMTSLQQLCPWVQNIRAAGTLDRILCEQSGLRYGSLSH